MDMHGAQQLITDLCDVRSVRIPDREGPGARSTITVTLLWCCPRCGKPRGTPETTTVAGLTGPLEVDAWANECQHADLYADLRQEAGLTP